MDIFMDVYIKEVGKEFNAFNKFDNFICADLNLEKLLDKLNRLGYNNNIYLEKRVLEEIIIGGKYVRKGNKI